MDAARRHVSPKESFELLPRVLGVDARRLVRLVVAALPVERFGEQPRTVDV